MIDIEEVNGLGPAEFEAGFADVAEHSPWVARNVAGHRPFASREAMIAGFRNVVMAASETAQLLYALIRTLLRVQSSPMSPIVNKPRPGWAVCQPMNSRVSPTSTISINPSSISRSSLP
jgi:hypothetical protein